MYICTTVEKNLFDQLKKMEPRLLLSRSLILNE